MASSTHAIILQTQDCSSIDQCGSLSYKGGIVEYMNNGYEIKSVPRLNPFLWVNFLTNIEIEGVTVKFNAIVEATASTGFFHVANFIRFSISACEFVTNFLNGNLLSILSSVSLPISNNFAPATANIVLSSLKISNNYSMTNLIKILMTGDLLNIAISNCVFEGNSGRIEMILIQYYGVITNELIFGYVDKLSNKAVPPKTIRIEKSSFVGQGSFTSLIALANLVNVDISDVTFERNGNLQPNFSQITIRNYLQTANIYSTQQPDYGSDVDCTSLITFTSVTNTHIAALRDISNQCMSGGTGLVYLGGSGIHNITSVYIFNNTCSGNSGIALYCTGPVRIFVSNMTAVGNFNYLKGVVFLQSEANLTIADSYFEGNRGYAGAGINSDGASALSIFRTTFKSNNSKLNSGGGVYFVPYFLYTPELSIIDCDFIGNIARVGGGVSINFYSSGASLKLTISQSRFRLNTAEVSGASLHTTSVVSFVDGALIDNCVFNGERANGGAMALGHLAGKFTVANSVFEFNSGGIAAGMNIQTDNSAEIVISNVTFRGNLAAPALAKPNSLINSMIVSKNCRFESNANGAILIEHGFWTDESSQFLSTNSSAVKIISNTSAYLQGTLFQSNTSPDRAGAVYLASQSYFNCSHCWFVRNTAKLVGGAVFYEQNSAVDIYECMFDSNSAGVYGSALCAMSSVTNTSTIARSIFSNNSAGASGVIYAQSSLLQLIFVTFDSNIAPITPGIDMLLSILDVISCTFRNQTGENSPFLTSQVNSSVTIRDSTLSKGSGVNSGCFLISESVFVLTDSVISDVHGKESGIIQGGGQNDITLIRITVRDVTSVSSGSLVNLITSSLRIDRGTFINFTNGGIVGISLTSLEIVDSRFDTGWGGAVYCSACVAVTINSTTFLSINSTLGAVYIENSYVTISNSRFEKNTASQGGALYAHQVQMTVSDSVFHRNVANVSDGGAVFFDCPGDEQCAYSFANATFDENSANRSGGAIAWSDRKPLLVNITASNNTANYGPDFASFPIKLSIRTAFTHARALQDASSATNSVPPGQSAGVTLTASLIDHYDQVVTIDSGSLADLAPTDTTKVAVSGITKVPAINGVYTFNAFSIYADPLTEAQLTVTTDAIKDQKNNNQSSKTTGVTFSMRPCLPGESQSSKACTVCQNGTYSFDPAKPCQDCFLHAKCLGMTSVIPSTGYWRSGIYSDKAWECPRPSSCLGGNPYDNGTVSIEGFCSTGYKSNMCQSCADEYSRSSKNKCGKCPPLEINIVRIVFVTIAVVLFNAYLLFAALKSATRPTALHSIYMKILVNYTQLVFLITEFKLNWPKPVLDLFSAQENSGGVAEQIYSVDCFLAGNGDTSNVFYRKMLFMALLPVGVIAAIVLFWLFVAAYNVGRKKLHIRRKLAATIVIAFFFIHPTLTKSLFSMFSCTEINPGEYWLTVDMALRCYDATYNFSVLTIGFPAVVVWVFGVPLTCLSILIKFRRQQDELWLRLQYGFLISGYRRQRYYWEFVVLFRKISIICCSVFFTGWIPLQALTVQIVLLFFYFLQHTVQPYTHGKLNSTESKGIIVAGVTIYCGLYYLTGELSVDGEWFFFSVIVGVNAWFLTYWFAEVVGFYIDMAAAAFPAIGRIFHPRALERDSYMEELISTLESEDKGKYQKFSISTEKAMYISLLKSRANVGERVPEISMLSRSYIPVMPKMTSEDSEGDQSKAIITPGMSVYLQDEK